MGAKNVSALGEAVGAAQDADGAGVPEGPLVDGAPAHRGPRPEVAAAPAAAQVLVLRGRRLVRRDRARRGMFHRHGVPSMPVTGPPRSEAIVPARIGTVKA